jgi:hypothetical protein
MNYYDYIQSQEWKQKSLEVKERRGYKCQVCGISGSIAQLETHHNCYSRLGHELDIDLVVLCSDCHDLFHKHGAITPNHKVKLSESKIFSILWDAGITYTSDDPWGNYSLGKSILWNLVEPDDWKTFDEYNKINISIVDQACLNEQRLEFNQAKISGDWDGFDSEYCYRCESNYWENWNGKL